MTSNESGVDHPELGVFRDTALDSFYFCGAIQRLICVNSTKVNGVLSRTALAANARELILVIVNDTEYGGSGGSVAVSSIHPAAVEIILHELGHSFGLLADEYGTCNSKMRSLGVPFEQINGEQLVKRVYNWVSPIDSYSPTSVTVTLSTPQVFSVTTPTPRTHSLDVQWRLDGDLLGLGSEVTLNPASVTPGTHTLSVVARDATTLVRTDPGALLQATRSWTVSVQCAVHPLAVFADLRRRRRLRFLQRDDDRRMRMDRREQQPLCVRHGRRERNRQRRRVVRRDGQRRSGKCRERGPEHHDCRRHGELRDLAERLPLQRATPGGHVRSRRRGGRRERKNAECVPVDREQRAMRGRRRRAAPAARAPARGRLRWT